MTCLTPLSVVQPSKGVSATVPCGQCIACRINKMREYEFLSKCALQQAYSHGKGASFVRLSYDDENLPITEYSRLSDRARIVQSTLRWRDLQKFHKRCRIFISRHLTGDLSYQHLSVSEYGEAADRPHYHIIFFGVDATAISRILRETWKFGFCFVGPLKDGGVRYLVDYCTQVELGKLAVNTYDLKGRERPRVFHSINLGLEWLMSQDISDGFVRFGQNLVPIPSRIRRNLRHFTRIDPDKSFVARERIARMNGYERPEDYERAHTIAQLRDFVVKYRQKQLPVADGELLRLQEIYNL